MKFLITIFQDEDGVYIAECPSIPVCFSQGTTEQEAEKNIQEAIKECLEVRVEKEMPLTRLTAKLTPAPEGGYIASNSETGTTTQGETVEEALYNLREANELYLEEFPQE